MPETTTVNDAPWLPKAEVQEPTFTIRAQDKTGHITVAAWAMMQERIGLLKRAGMDEDEAVNQVQNDIFNCFSGQHSTCEKTKEAFGIATRMAEWPVKKIAD